MQFTKVFTILALASAGLASATSPTQLTGTVSKEAMDFIKVLSGSNTGSLNGRGMRPIERRQQTTGACSVGSPHCCNQVIHNDGQKKTLAGLLGVNDVVGSIGLQCNNLPINVIGAAFTASNYCKSTPVCCTNVTQNGLVNLGCTALPLN